MSLIDNGANLNDIDTSFKDGRSALHKAASVGHTRIIELLLSRGADPNILDAKGKTYSEILDDFTCSIESHEKDNFEVKSSQEYLPVSLSLQNSLGESLVSHDKDFSLILSESNEQQTAIQCSQCNAADIAFRRRGDRLLCQKCSK